MVLPFHPIQHEPPTATLSQFEQLPRELVFEVLGYVPEKVFDLRLTSRLLKWRVDEYALQRTTIPLVMEVEVSYSPSHFGRFMLSVVWYKAHLFDLRLKMQIPTAECCKEKYSHYCTYTFDIPSELDSDRNIILEHLREAMGSSIGKANVRAMWHNGMNTLEMISRHFVGISIHDLLIHCNHLDESGSQALLAFIDAHNVNQLALFTRELSASGHVSVLFQFATVLRSLYIYQSHFAEIERLNSNYFLGFVDEDWAAIILEMFSRKLDKLFIDNHSCPKYLSVNNIAFLNERLTALDKRIWFEASCMDHAISLDCTINDNIVQIYPNVYGTTVQIKHSTRQHEIFNI